VRLAPLVFAVALSGACTVNSGIDAPATNNVDVEPSAEADTYAAADFLTDYTGAFCDWVIGCAATLGPTFPDQRACLDFLDVVFVIGDSDLANIGDPLLYRVDPERARACVAAVRAAACDEESTLDLNATPPCNEVLIGRLNDGECCDDRGGCAPGLVCEQTSDGVGHCSATGDYGETCYSQPCVDGAVCRTFDDPSGPPTQVCIVPFDLAPGVACQQTDDCGTGLYCKAASPDVAPTCSARPEANEFCSPPTTPCVSGLHCGAVSGFATTCSATPFPAGGRCFETSDCQSGLVCTPNHDCVTPAAAGAACDYDIECAAPLGCFDNRCGTRVAPSGIGDDCTPDGPSCPGFIEEGQCVNGKCVAPAQEGDPCNPDDVSLATCSTFAYLVCDPSTQRCRSLPKVGEACPDGACYSFFINTCIDGFCAPRRDIGASCTPQPEEDKGLTSQCKLGSFCIDNVCTRIVQSGRELCK
jgi:hypothetical protein